jgi:hypothetical protein
VNDRQPSSFEIYLRKSQEPILRDLELVGVSITGVWGIKSDPNFESGLPVLMKHLESDSYPDQVQRFMARGFATPVANPYWDQLARIYLATPPDREQKRDGLAAALAASAKKRNYSDLKILADRDDGVERIYFLSRIAALGSSDGKQFVLGKLHDPLLGREAQAISKRREWI